MLKILQGFEHSSRQISYSKYVNFKIKEWYLYLDLLLNYHKGNWKVYSEHNCSYDEISK